MSRQLLQVCVGLVAALLPAPPVAAQYRGELLRCESRDYRDNYCPANTRGGVRLVRQLSRARCYEGETWGYDRRGVWVSDGCAADFELGHGDDRPRDAYRDGRSPPRGGRTVVCESRDYRYHYCPVRIERDVDLIVQRSKSECRFNRSWGYDRGGIWVDRGCAAEFVVF